MLCGALKNRPFASSLIGSVMIACHWAVQHAITNFDGENRGSLPLPGITKECGTHHRSHCLNAPQFMVTALV